MKNSYGTGTSYEQDEDVLVDDQIEETKKIVLYNDDVNSFQHVIVCLMKYCKHSIEQAEQCAMIVHTRGKCSVKSGSYEELEPIATALLEKGLSVEIE